jgi:hypothetical protein
MRPVTDATEASLSKGVSRSQQNAAQSTQARAAYRPQPRAHASDPSATAWMREDARGVERGSGVEVPEVVVGH